MSINLKPEVQGFLAFVTISALGRLGKDSALAPDATTQIEMARMCQNALDGFFAVEAISGPERTAELLEPYRGLVDELEARLRPGGWWERAVKTQVLLGFYADLQQVLLADLPAEEREALAPLPTDFGHGEWTRKVLSDLVADDPVLRDRLSLWGRRVFGDTVSTARTALRGVGTKVFTPEVVAQLTEAHGNRMAQCGLAG